VHERGKKDLKDLKDLKDPKDLNDSDSPFGRLVEQRARSVCSSAFRRAVKSLPVANGTLFNAPLKPELRNYRSVSSQPLP